MNDALEQLHRIFLGDKSLWFLLEVAFRTTFIFSYTLILLRFMGKRGMGQLTPFEFAIIVALGSAVGDPMFYDDVPLLHTMLVIAIVILLHRFLAIITQKNEVVERFIEGQTRLIINQGHIIPEALDHERISREELCEMLRTEGISHLGEVRQAFLEPSGRLAVIRWDPARSGLSILPHCDDTDYAQRSDAKVECCAFCGLAKNEATAEHQCQRIKWVTSVAE